MSNQESYRATREAQRETTRAGRKTPHEDAITRYLAAFAYAEEREEERDDKPHQTPSGEAVR
jgi:hypothetical protein